MHVHAWHTWKIVCACMAHLENHLQVLLAEILRCQGRLRHAQEALNLLLRKVTYCVGQQVLGAHFCSMQENALVRWQVLSGSMGSSGQTGQPARLGCAPTAR